MSDNPHGQEGFTLLELLVVLMIIALLAGFVGPRLFSQVDQAKEKTAMSQMKNFSDALGQYRLDTGRYPSQEMGLSALVERPAGASKWNGPYLNQEIPTDPWGEPYQWHNPAKGISTIHEVEIISIGSQKPLAYGF